MSWPRFSVIEFTSPKLSFAEDLHVYRRAGADGIGIVESKLGDDEQDLGRLSASGLSVSSFFPAAASILPGALLPGPADPRLRLTSLLSSVRRAARFGADSLFVTTGPVARRPAPDARRVVVESLRTLARAGADEGVTVALEVLHPSLERDFSYVTSVSAAVQILREVGDPNLALALDMWHIGEDPDVLVLVREYASMCASVHVNDRRRRTRSWCDRVLPGDGIDDLTGILGALDGGGFTGWFELEVISDDGTVEHDFADSLWKLDPLELITKGRSQFQSLWERRTPHGQAPPRS